jgi:hypothetical protein
VTEYGKTSKTMDALERLKSEMAKYGDIEPKERDEKATLDAQAKALLENAKRLIDALGLIAHNHIRYSSHRAEKGGGAGAFQVDRTTALRAKDVRYVWEVVLPYVRSGRTLWSLADGVEQKDRERGHFVRGYELTGAALVCSDRRV